MPITVANAFKLACLNGGLGALNTGGADPSGDLEFLTAADLSLAVLALSTTAFQNATMNGANAQASSNSISPALSPTPGTIAKARLRDRGNAALLSFAVSLVNGGGDMIVGVVDIPPGTTSVTCSGLVVTAAFA
jgi:hypothetical protein